MPASKLPESLSADIQQLIESHPSIAAVPAGAFGIVKDGELSAFFAHGFIDLESREKPTERSIARVASVTKTFTATAIMQLRDASLLALDDPLLLHIPEFTAAQAKAAPLEGVTIRRLLTHHSGLSTEHPDLDWDTPDFPMIDHVMDSLEKIQVVIPQDSQWKYSNLAYCLLGEVVSRLSGKPYIDYVHEEIISPLGLENTAFDLSADQQALKMTGYSPPEPGNTELRAAPYGHLNGFSSAGQLQTNIEDLVTWIQFHLGEGPESVLSKQSRAEMRRPVYIADDWSSGQGLGWRAVRRGENVFWNHGGAVHGFSTSVVFNVPARAGVVMLLNMWPSGQSSDLALSIADIVAGGTIKPPASSAGASDTPSSSERPVESEFAGSYWAEPGLPLEVAGTASGISFSSPAEGVGLHCPANLVPSGEEGSFTVVNGRGAGETAAFTRSESGVITGFTLGGFKYRKLD